MSPLLARPDPAPRTCGLAPPAPRKLVALVASVALVVSGCGGAAVSTPSGPPTVTLLHAAPNPTGLAVGFYELHGAQATTLATTGRRPVARVGFDTWSMVETSPGVYTFPAIDRFQRTHAFGERAQVALDVSFTDALSPNGGTIPPFYAQDITDPATRAAAKSFVYAYVQWLLKGAGAVVLTIDYEVVGNWQLQVDDAGRDARAATWRDWYLAAAHVARQAAADLGMSGSLLLQPIVNSDPLAPGNPMGLGPVPRNQWLADVVAASDAFGVDTYFSDMSRAPEDPGHTLDIIQFWIDAFSAGKAVDVTENGFSTVTSIDPGITRAQHQGKLTGTEAQQAAYFASLFPLLRQRDAPGGPFHGQLRSFGIWSIGDNPFASDEASIYYGLVRLDGTEKPAAPVVRDALAALEADATSRPWAWNGSGTDVTAANATAAGTSLVFSDGDHFDALRLTVPALAAGPGCRVMGRAKYAGSLLVGLNGSWTQADLAAGLFSVDLPATSCHPGAVNVADVYAPGSRFPFTQVLSQVALTMQ